MQITLTKEQVKEAFGELRFMGADNSYRYDKCKFRFIGSPIPLATDQCFRS